MSASKSVQELNRELARKLIDEGRNNPQCAYLGKFVGIANGQVVAVADSWDELAGRLRQIEPDPTKTFGVEVGRDYDAVELLFFSWPYYTPEIRSHENPLRQSSPPRR
jgi:hypothetical protein